MSLSTYDLIIIGAGPAGLTAGLYAGMSRLNTLILEKMSVGGRIIMSERIENFPGFPGGILTYDLINRISEQVKELGIKIEVGEVKEIDCMLKSVKTDEQEFSAKSIIIATGARPKKLGIPGEDRFTGKGLSYCATCDANFFKEKDVAIVGGGNALAEEALYLARFAKKVFIIHRRDELRASRILQEKLKANKKINFILSHIVKEIRGQKFVDSIKIQDVKSFQESILPCDGIFVYIGYIPETDFLKGKLELDEAGFIITQEDMATSEKGLFACGDCRKKSLYQVITACADGAISADSAYKYISSKG
ncbi:MAG: thioredoxin-disulfide reductase [Candidatus Omnitrophica bacterium]|nr:thioredoxin-disulfide reductase [Candidatus Omnitrophota bacterium]